MSHQCTSGDAEVGTGIVERGVHEEVFLFPTEVGIDTLHVRYEKFTYFGRRLIDCCQRFQERCLVVECLAGVRDKYGRNTQCLVYDEGRGGNVPCGVASCLESIANTSVGKARSIRFLLDEQFAGETLDDVSVIAELDEAVMLLGGTVGERLKPVRVMGYVESLCPTLHAVGNHVRHFAVEGNTVLDGIDDCLVGFFGKKFLHLLAVKHVCAVVVRQFLGWIFYGNGLSVREFL